jgi:hypothetical protein
MAASDLSGRRADVLLTGKLLGDCFRDPRVARDTAGAAQTRPVDGGPNLRIEAKALAPSVVQLCARVIRCHAGQLAPEWRQNQEQTRNAINAA